MWEVREIAYGTRKEERRWGPVAVLPRLDEVEELAAAAREGWEPFAVHRVDDPEPGRYVESRTRVHVYLRRKKESALR